jgi:hypothetical protein
MHTVISDNCGVARSVAGMKGTYLASADLSDLAAMMKKSQDSWNGRIAAPEILEQTPARFAERFSAAFVAAYSDRQNRQTTSRPPD